MAKKRVKSPPEPEPPIPQPFAVGDRVRCRYVQAGESDEVVLIMRVTAIRRGSWRRLPRDGSILWSPSSGWWVSAASEPCPTCHRPLREPVGPVDSAWFERDINDETWTTGLRLRLPQSLRGLDRDYTGGLPSSEYLKTQ